MRTVAIIQARMGSTRLPGKVLMDIFGKPMIQRVIDRISRSSLVDEILLAIPKSRENDVLEEFAKSNGIKLFRGEENDVLSRYYDSAKSAKADIIVRITSDCPLIDAEISDGVIKKCLRENCDLSSNFLKRTFPRGMDTEAFSFSVLERVFEEARESHQREHVTPYIYENSSKFKIIGVEAEPELFRPELRLTVDTEEDMTLIREIYQELGGGDDYFSLRQIIDLMDKKPELKEINKNIVQKPVKTF